MISQKMTMKKSGNNREEERRVIMNQPELSEEDWIRFRESHKNKDGYIFIITYSCNNRIYYWLFDRNVCELDREEIF